MNKKELYEAILTFFLENPDCDQTDVAVISDKAFNQSGKEIIRSYQPLKIELESKNQTDFKSDQKPIHRKTYEDESTFS